MAVSLTTLPKEIGGTFSERLASSHSVALVQLTGRSLLKAIRDGNLQFAAELRRLSVFMPDPAYSLPSAIGKAYPGEADTRTATEEWIEFLRELESTNPKATVKLGLMRVASPWGGSFTDWDRPGGVVHVSPYLWDRDPRECPGYDLEWKTGQPQNVYQAYVQSLEWLDNNTPNALISDA